MESMQDSHTLIVVRHGKAGELPGGPDFERALRPRGQRDSEAAGHWLVSHGYQPDAVICSAARRTRQTWQYLGRGLAAEPQVSVDEQLYRAEAEDVLAVISQTPPATGTLLYVGHNPAAAGLVALLTGEQAHFPTAATAVINVSSDWADLNPGGGTLIALWTPPAAGA